MNLIKALFCLFKAQIRNISKLLSGYPVMISHLGSTTLDLDDVAIAKQQLKQRNSWYDSSTVQEFESAFALWNGSRYAKAFMGGRIALSACIYALNLQPGDEVIMPGYTCVVVPNAFAHAGVKVVYSDIELDTYGLDASQIVEKITPKTKAILLHHLYGLVCRDYENIIKIARDNGLYVIEDCAQSTGAEFINKKVGNLGDIAIYSSEQSKVFNTIQGGLATTNDDQLGKKIEEYYNKAIYPTEDYIEKILYNVLINYYSYKDRFRWLKSDFIRCLYMDKILISTTEDELKGEKPIFYNMKMPSPIAAIGLTQLKKIDHYILLRRENARKWQEVCAKNKFQSPQALENSKSIFLRYPILAGERKKQNAAWARRKFKVDLGVWFTSNIHPSLQKVDGCPNANRAVRECINFPGLL